MSFSPMLSPSVKPQAAGDNRFAVITLPTFGPAGLGAPETEALLKKLVSEPWQRVSSEYDDPLGMLFTNKVKQWTAGWGAASNAQALAPSMYVLVWEVDSWNNTPTWSLYENGRLIHESRDNRQNPLAPTLKRMLEGEDLPFISHENLLAPLRQAAPHSQALLFHHFSASLLNRPEMLPHLQTLLLDWLGEKITLTANADDMATRLQQETAILQQLEAKNLLIQLFRRLYEKNLLKPAADKARLFQALQYVQDDYFYLGYQINPVFRTAYDRAYDAFRRQLIDGQWQVRLKREAATAS